MVEVIFDINFLFSFLLTDKKSVAIIIAVHQITLPATVCVYPANKGTFYQFNYWLA